MTLSDNLEDYNESLDSVCPKFGGSHDYTELDRQFISKQVIELDLICLQCSEHKYVYNYLEDSL